MARVPTVGERGQAVGTVQQAEARNQFQSMQTNADMFGAAQGRSLQQASAGLNGIAAAFKQKAEDDDNLVILENDNAADAFKRDLMHNAETGLLTRQGKNAVGMSEEAARRFDEYAASLPQPKTQEGRLAQQEKLLKMKAVMLNTASTHERTQVEAYKTEQIETSLGNHQQEMGTAYSDPVALANAEKGIRAEAETLAARRGMSDEAKEEFVEASVSKGYADAIDAALANEDYATAERLLDENSGKMQPEDRDAAKEAVATGTVLGYAQKEADRIMSQRGLSGPERLALARQEPDPKRREELVAMVKTRVAEEAAFEDKARQDRFDAASNAARNGQPVSEPMRRGLTARQNAYIDDVAEEQALRAANPNYTRPTQEAALEEINAQQGADPTWLQTMPFADLRDGYKMRLNPTDWRNLQSDWLEAQNDKRAAAQAIADAKEEAADYSGFEPNTRIREILQAVGASEEEVAPKHERFTAFRSEFDARIASLAGAGIKITPIVEQDVLKQMAAERINIDDEAVFAFRADPDQRREYAREIFNGRRNFREADRLVQDFDNIRNELAIMGMPMTSIREAYKALVRNGTTQPTLDEIMETIRYNAGS